MYLNIDLISQKLVGRNCEIQFNYPKTNESGVTYSVEANEKTIKFPTVNILKSDILIINRPINNLLIPEVATMSQNGYATIEIQNPTNQISKATLTEPLPINLSEKVTYEIYNFESTWNTSPNLFNFDIEYLIHIDHMSQEEKESYFKNL